MGIRIHKALGYGLTDVRVDGRDRITDERINPQSPLLTDELADPPSLDDYLAFLEAESEGRREGDPRTPTNYLDFAYLKHDRKHDPRPPADLAEAVIHSREYGLPNVVLIRPISCRRWVRYDDPIDYEEEMRGSLPEPNRVRVLAHPIHPFAAYMDAETAERLDERIVRHWRMVKSSDHRLDAEWALGKLESLARELGYAGREEAERRIVPEVPVEVRDIARFGELFTSDEVWKQLRPVIYTYWG